MPSKLKSETARANGAKSRGPKTAAGREKSSCNSLGHGLTSRNTLILEYESPQEFALMLAEYRTIYEPATAAESDLVDQMVAARWRIRRIWTIETALFDCEIARRREEVKREFGDVDGAVELALAFQSLADESRALGLLSRYEARLHRIHDRAYRTLRELQQKRRTPAEHAQPAANPLNPNPALHVSADPAGGASPENTEIQNEPSAQVWPRDLPVPPTGLAVELAAGNLC